jgi:Na+-translocating ferredoxin:NAD+ oxidoreductase subunit B
MALVKQRRGQGHPRRTDARPPDNPAVNAADLVDALHGALPQTQCTRCSYPDCRGYAQAIAAGEADINQCPPGGAEGIERLSRLTGRPIIPLNPANGHEGPRQLAVIDEGWCIGCTLCIKACPVDCIVGAPKLMHTVIDALCTGCELCIPVCPVDCISLVNVTGERSGWHAWSAAQAAQARSRYAFHQQRLLRDKHDEDARLEALAQRKLDALGDTACDGDNEPAELERKRAMIEAALAKARARRGETDH